MRKETIKNKKKMPLNQNLPFFSSFSIIFPTKMLILFFAKYQSKSHLQKNKINGKN